MATTTTAAKRWYSTGEAALVLRISERRVRALCEAGRLGEKIGRNWAIGAAELKRFAALDRPAVRPPETREKGKRGEKGKKRG